MENTLIYLIGFAGTGKLSIAQALSLQVNLRIVDNHLINNPIFSVIYTDGHTPIPRAAWHKIHAIRESVYTAIEELSPENWSFAFTNELLEGSIGDRCVFDRVAQIATQRKSLFVPVRLLCDLDELCRRVQSPERTRKFKLTSVEITQTIFSDAQVLNISFHPHAMTLDVTYLTAQESAEKIIQHVRALKK